MAQITDPKTLGSMKFFTGDELGEFHQILRVDGLLTPEQAERMRNDFGSRSFFGRMTVDKEGSENLSKFFQLRKLSRWYRLKRWAKWKILRRAKMVTGVDLTATHSTCTRCLHWDDGTIEILDVKTYPIQHEWRA